MEAPLGVENTVSMPLGHNRAMPVTVATWNVYVGADIDAVMAAPSPEMVPWLVSQAWAELQATNFPERARAIALEIREADPDLVGLQEVSTFRRQSPGDFLYGNPIPAEDVVLDFLPELLVALNDLGLDYTPIAITVDFDIEVPMLTPEGGLDDVRLTDHEVILARSDVDFGNVQTGIFAASLDFEMGGEGGVPVSITRGWASADISVRGSTFRFISTHLEPAHPLVQFYQAQELVGILATTAMPIILVGDFNSPADGSGGPAYGILTDAGMDDAWDELSLGTGLTCCNVSDLSNVTSTFYSRIDLVLARGFSGAEKVERLGTDQEDRTVSGLWASDHAGLKARLRF
jgi:endonuclease/exonuclease/phosphatase family metal-dependent hydrolase